MGRASFLVLVFLLSTSSQLYAQQYSYSNQAVRQPADLSYVFNYPLKYNLFIKMLQKLKYITIILLVFYGPLVVDVFVQQWLQVLKRLVLMVVRQLFDVRLGLLSYSTILGGVGHLITVLVLAVQM